jgi:nucleoside-diphosphate-sugar epimerase
MAKYLVTGGAGFIGGRIVNALIARGDSVITVSRGDYPHLKALGVTHYSLDLSSCPKELESILSGVDAVFHVAAVVKMWGPYQDFYQGNIEATRHLLECARKAGVKRFIFTSSPSVVAHGEDLRGVDERQPYPEHFDAFYPETKAASEQLVIQAHDPIGLHTIVLRPHLVFGPGDNHIIPLIVERARTGKLVQIGEGKNVVDFTYIDDCVAGHLCAEAALKRDPSVGGQPYFITQGDPVPMWWWIQEVVKRSNLAPVTKKVSRRVALFLARTSEFFYRMFPRMGAPKLTTFLIDELSTDHYFNITAAKEKLGYCPSMTTLEALDKTFIMK